MRIFIRQSHSVLHRLYGANTLKERPHTLSRWMSSHTESARARHKFIVYAPDMTNEGAFQRRLSVRQAHLDNASEQAKKGIVSKFSCALRRWSYSLIVGRTRWSDANAGVHPAEWDEEDGRIYLHMRGR